MRFSLALALLVVPLAACRHPTAKTAAADPSNAGPAAAAAQAASTTAPSAGRAYLDPESPDAFVHRRTWTEGYFIPQAKVQVGDYVLRDVYVGSTADFDRFEQGGHGGSAPFRLDFDRASTSKSDADEVDVSRKPAFSVNASAYYVSELDDREDQHVFKFVGSDARLGRLRLQATEHVPVAPKFEPPALRNQTAGKSERTLTGALEANRSPQAFVAEVAKGGRKGR